MSILISKAYKTQNNIITSVLKKIISILQLGAACQNEFRFDLLAITYAFFFCSAVSKITGKKLNQIYHPTISKKHIQPKCTCMNLSSFATEQRIALCRRQNHFHKSRHNAFRKNVFYDSA